MAFRSCCFFGHKDVFDATDNIAVSIINIVEPLIKKGLSIFMFGGYGRFDEICFSAIQSLKLKYQHVKTIFVQSYYKPVDSYHEYLKNKYDDVVFPELVNRPLRFSIVYRNRYIIDNSDLCVFYVDHTWGGAYNTMRYAIRKKKDIVNICEGGHK